MVPVGEDQKQHLELCRDIAIKFNNDYGVDFFPVVEPVIEGAATRVMTLRDGTKKMSKSDPSDQSRINLTDSADTIAAKIRKAKTDPEPLPDSRRRAEGPARGAEPGEHLRRPCRPHASTQVVRDFAGAQFGTFKPALADLAVAKLSPITTEMNRLMADPAEIDRILGDGRRPGRCDRPADPGAGLRHRRHDPLAPLIAVTESSQTAGMFWPWTCPTSAGRAYPLPLCCHGSPRPYWRPTGHSPRTSRSGGLFCGCWTLPGRSA